MKFDIESTVKSMLSMAGNVAGKEVKDTAQQFLEMNKMRIEKLVHYRLSGKIDQADFESRLADEEKMLEAQFNTQTIISKVKAQNAANAIMEVLQKAVKAAIPI